MSSSSVHMFNPTTCWLNLNCTNRSIGRPINQLRRTNCPNVGSNRLAERFGTIEFDNRPNWPLVRTFSTDKTFGRNSNCGYIIINRCIVNRARVLVFADPWPTNYWAMTGEQVFGKRVLLAWLVILKPVDCVRLSSSYNSRLVARLDNAGFQASLLFTSSLATFSQTTG